MKEQTQDDIIPGTEEILHLINHEFHDEMQGYFVELMKTLENDQKFYQVLVETPIIRGKGGNKMDVQSMINEHYGNELYPGETEKKVLSLARKIIDLAAGSKAILDKIHELPAEDQGEVYDISRDEIIGVMGEIITSLDYCDV